MVHFSTLSLWVVRRQRNLNDKTEINEELEEMLTDHDCELGRKPCSSSSRLRNLSTPLLPITRPKDTLASSQDSQYLSHGQRGASTALEEQLVLLVALVTPAPLLLPH